MLECESNARSDFRNLGNLTSQNLSQLLNGKAAFDLLNL